MKTHKINGKLRFSPDQHLTMLQVKVYFSKLATEKRKKATCNSMLNANQENSMLLEDLEDSVGVKSKDEESQIEEENT